MALLPILQYPDARLRRKALPVTEFTDEIKRIVTDMFETMYASEGVGLAATQVNITQRIVVMDVSPEKNSPLCVINPEIIQQDGIQYESEGCLSVPDLYDRVERAASIRVRALDQQGVPFEMAAEGHLAICFQHEIDHLNGVLFVDHLSRMKQERFRKKIEKGLSRAE